MARSVRTTVSVPEDLYTDLAKAAELSHVSTAWVIREALRLYLGKNNTLPLARVGTDSSKQRNPQLKNR